MFAIVRTGGKQYRVAAGDKIVVEKIDGEAGARVSLTDILFAGADGTAQGIAGLTVAAEIVAQAKADKIIVFKKKRRHNYRRKNGHRQQHTILKILSVGAEEKKVAPKKEAAPRAEAAPEAVAAPAPKAAATPAKKADAAPAKTAEAAPAKKAPAKKVAKPAAAKTEKE